MPSKRDYIEFVKLVANMDHVGYGSMEDNADTLNRLISDARLLCPIATTNDEKWIEWAMENGAEFHPPEDGVKYWRVLDANEETWRVVASECCETKVAAAIAYCEDEGCDEPPGIDGE